jgi:hypothetical protein
MTYFNNLKQIQPMRDEEDNKGVDDEPVIDDIGGKVSDDSGGSTNPYSGTGQFGTRKETDTQTVTRLLNPDLGKDLNHITASRVFPDVFRAYQRMLVKSLIFKNRGKTEGSIVPYIAMTNTALTMAIDGEHIIDMLALIGGTKRDEAAKENNSLGFPK